MKVFLVVAGLLFVAWQIDARAIEGSSDELDENDEECIRELHLNRDHIAAVDMGKTLPETDTEFTKFMGCTAKRQGMINEKNEVDYDKLIEEMLDVARKDPEFTPAMFSFYKQIIVNAIGDCHQPAGSATGGKALVKTMNCMTRKLEELSED